MQPLRCCTTNTVQAYLPYTPAVLVGCVAVCPAGLVHAPDQGVDLGLTVAGLAALNVVQALLVNAATGAVQGMRETARVSHVGHKTITVHYSVG